MISGVSKYSARYKPTGWKGESQRHYLAAKGVKTKKVQPHVTKEQFRKEAKAAFLFQFRPREIIIPSEKNEEAVAKAIHTGILLRRQNKAKKKAAKEAKKTASVELKKEINRNNNIRSRLKGVQARQAVREKGFFGSMFGK